MSELKHTPWKVVSWNAVGGKTYYAVQNCKGLNFIDFLDEPTAREIAALPQTLERIEKCKAGTLRKTELIIELREAVISADSKVTTTRKEFDRLKEELNKVNSERDELKKFVSEILQEWEHGEHAVGPDWIITEAQALHRKHTKVRCNT